MDIDEKIHVEFSIQLRQEDIPDTTAYGKKYNNTYLSNYAVIGISSIYGQGLYYQRYCLNYFFAARVEQIIDVNYYVRAFFCPRL